MIGAVSDPRLADLAGQMLDSILTTPDAADHLPADSLDAIMLCNLEGAREDAFAWLARMCMRREPTNTAPVTGAAGPRVLGAIYPA